MTLMVEPIAVSTENRHEQATLDFFNKLEWIHKALTRGGGGGKGPRAPW